MITPYKGKFKVSQIYKGATHKGMDLVGIDSKNIYSPVIGSVESVRVDTHYTGGMGLYIRIEEFTTGYKYYFAHLSDTNVKEGQVVGIGDKIGVEGSTGHSTGSHLHFEVRKSTNNTTFLDVSELSGIPNKLGTYEGGEDLTEAETRKIVAEMLQGKESEVSDWAKESWNKATENGITDGERPKGYATREEVITIIERCEK